MIKAQFEGKRWDITLPFYQSNSASVSSVDPVSGKTETHTLNRNIDGLTGGKGKPLYPLRIEDVLNLEERKGGDYSDKYITPTFQRLKPTEDSKHKKKALVNIINTYYGVNKYNDDGSFTQEELERQRQEADDEFDASLGDGF